MQEDPRPWLTATYSPEQKKFYFEHRDDYKDVSTDGIFKNIHPDDSLSYIKGRIIKEMLDKRYNPNGVSTEEKDDMPSAYYEPDGCPWCGADLTEEDGTYHCYCCGYDHKLERNDYKWVDNNDED